MSYWRTLRGDVNWHKIVVWTAIAMLYAIAVALTCIFVLHR
jgi:hypothetical protein